MKKVLIVAVAGLFVFASCKKDYECTGPNGTNYGECTSCNKSQKTAFETNCSAIGGSVSEK